MGSPRIRPARPEDSRTLAELFLIAASPFGEYVWGLMAEPDEGVLETGARLYAGDGPHFSWRDCLVAEGESGVLGMAHAFAIPEGAEGPVAQDPVLRPFIELELPNSYYLSALAVFEWARRRGAARRLMDGVNERAKSSDAKPISLVLAAWDEPAGNLYRQLGFRERDRRSLSPLPPFEDLRGDLLLLVRDPW